MTIGILLVAVWFAAVAVYLVRQFVRDAFAEEACGPAAGPPPAAAGAVRVVAFPAPAPAGGLLPARAG